MPSGRRPLRRGRRRGKVTVRPAHRLVGQALQVGDARRGGRAVTPAQRRDLLSIALAEWPDEGWFEVAIFARWRARAPEEDSGTERTMSETYPNTTSREGKYYYGWRSSQFRAAVFGMGAPVVVQFLFESFDGRTPIRAMSVRPAE